MDALDALLFIEDGYKRLSNYKRVLERTWKDKRDESFIRIKPGFEGEDGRKLIRKKDLYKEISYSWLEVEIFYTNLLLKLYGKILYCRLDARSVCSTIGITLETLDGYSKNGRHPAYKEMTSIINFIAS